MDVPEIKNSRSVPSHFKWIGEIQETTDDGRKDYRFLYLYKGMLVVLIEYTSYADEDRDPRTGKPALFFSQVEFPLEAASWVVDKLGPFGREGLMPGTMTKLDFEINDERLSLIRGPGIGGPDVPGWELVNYSRRYRNDDIARFQAFPMSDPFLWEQGMFDLWKNIAQRHKQGEF